MRCYAPAIVDSAALRSFLCTRVCDEGTVHVGTVHIGTVHIGAVGQVGRTTGRGLEKQCGGEDGCSDSEEAAVMRFRAYGWTIKVQSMDDEARLGFHFATPMMRDMAVMATQPASASAALGKSISTPRVRHPGRTFFRSLGHRAGGCSSRHPPAGAERATPAANETATYCRN